jgi:hypothetical protein
LIDEKYLLLHYIHGALAYHSSAMQNLTKLFSSVSATDPREELNVRNYKMFVS